jgi:hypothetical protein
MHLAGVVKRGAPRRDDASLRRGVAGVPTQWPVLAAAPHPLLARCEANAGCGPHLRSGRGGSAGPPVEPRHVSRARGTARGCQPTVGPRLARLEAVARVGTRRCVNDARELLRSLLDACPGAEQVTTPRAWLLALLSDAPHKPHSKPPRLPQEASSRQLRALTGS